MLKMLLRELVYIAMTLWIVSMIIFALIRIIPGNPVEAQLTQAGLDTTTIQAELERYGFNQPIWRQYMTYVANTLTGEWGNSLYNGQDVLQAWQQRLPITLHLAVVAMLIAVVIGSIGGILSVLSSNILIKSVINTSFSLIQAIPIYWSATLTVFVIGWSQWGMSSRSIWLASIILGIHTSSLIGRVIITSLNQTKTMPYVSTAISKGLTRSQTVIKYVILPALPHIIPLLTIQFGYLLAGTILTEIIFGQAGIGSLLLTAIQGQDYPVIQIITLYIATLFIILNSVSRFIVAFIDPRIQFHAS